MSETIKTEKIGVITAAKRLGYRQRFVYQLLQQGRIKHVERVGARQIHMITVPLGHAPVIDPPVRRRRMQKRKQKAKPAPARKKLV